MTAQEIEVALAERYKGQGWAKFFQFRPMTSFEAVLNAIDLLVVGLWHKNEKIIAHEIKVCRGDFLKDLQKFKHKHKFALQISEEFYYVCPFGLIKIEELPKIAGLMYVNQNKNIKIAKPASLRIIKSIPFQLFQGFTREFGNKVEYSKIPAKYLGKDMTQDELMGIVKEKVTEECRFEIDKKVNEIIEAKEKKQDARSQLWRELMKVCNYYTESDDDEYKEIIRYCELGKKLSTDYDFLHYLNLIKEKTDNLIALLNREKEKS
jgi:hypothetical protein